MTKLSVAGPALLGASLLAACSSAASHSSTQHSSTAHSSTAAITSPAVHAAPYSLYTHCGIDEARVGATYFSADTPLNDGQGNPPKGWDNPYQQGTIQLTSSSVAVFRDDKGHVVRFHARPGATGFLQICS